MPADLSIILPIYLIVTRLELSHRRLKCYVEMPRESICFEVQAAAETRQITENRIDESKYSSLA